ncbi:hypothetical protein JOF56_003179 [Kibdelosporangium banguiense]|uniref:CU044_5270 family protein n=1 Tax=Kibdelosporangium banguiense TaxID=1365924 RepID=A0ABS4TFN0_9PSEU|nr:CU044_5270 family protein [Kibdelosporangium banguiense]MBP2322794.1 hypothetical protein [Kibdelosporangium banguiense]
MRHDEDRVDFAVRDLAPDVPPMSETNFDAGRDRVLAGAAGVQSPHRQPRRWIGAAAAVAALTAGTMAVINFSDSGLTPSADAVTVLNTAADMTVNATDSPVGSGQYRYIKKKESRWLGVVLHGALDANCWYRYEQTEETWIPADRDQDWLRRTTHTEPLETKSCTKQEAMDAPFYFNEVTPWESRAKNGKFTLPDLVPPKQTAPPRSVPDGALPLGVNIDKQEPAPPIPVSILNPTPEFLAGLTRDPQQLFVLLRDSTCLAEACAFHAAQSVLGTGEIPGDLRAAIYRALTKIPGMTTVDNLANLDGRTGIAIRVSDSQWKWTKDMIVDQSTGDYIGDRTLQDTSAGKLLDSSAVTIGVADAIGTPPAR